MVVECRRPVGVPLFLGLGVGIRVVLDVPLLEPLARGIRAPVAAAPVQHVQDHARIGDAEIVAHGVVVDRRDRLELLRIAPGADPLVQVHLTLEAEVLGGEWVAVGPLHPLAQVEREGHVVVRQLVIPGLVRLDGTVEVHPQRVLAALGRVAAVDPGMGAGAEHVQRAAVGTDFLQGYQHVRLDGKTLFQRRQVARGHHGRQHRRFLVLAVPGHRGRRCRRCLPRSRWPRPTYR